VRINIAVIDSGIDPNHRDLNVAGGVDAQAGCGSVAWADRLGHGTMVTGIIGSHDNRIGRVGVAPGARLWSIRVTHRTLAVRYSAVLCAVDAVTRTRIDGIRSNDVAVANMSLGFPGSDDQDCGRQNEDALHRAICTSTAAGVTYVAAAGNDAEDIAGRVPAAYDEVLTATAMADFDGRRGGKAPAPCWGVDLSESTADDYVAFFSNAATTRADARHVVAAPGVCVDAPLPVSHCQPGNPHPRECYITTSPGATGTSFASPFGAGTVALCIAHGPCHDRHPRSIIRTITSDAARHTRAHPGYGYEGDPLRPFGRAYYGYLIRAAMY
jgi:subtilisin